MVLLVLIILGLLMKKLFNLAISIVPTLIILSFFMPGLNIPVIKYVPILVGEAFQLLESDDKKKIRLEEEERIKFLKEEIKKLGPDIFVKYLLDENPVMPDNTAKALKFHYDNQSEKDLINYDRMHFSQQLLSGESLHGLLIFNERFDKLFGQNLEIDVNLGMKLVLKAAESNFENAQNDLMMAYANGKYVKEDKLLAYMYGRLALAHPKSKKAQDLSIRIFGKVTDGMTESEIAQGERLASLCKGKNYKNCGY